MRDVLFWVYLSNAVILIVHEIDSAYWREWELFRLPGGRAAFLVLHIPLLALVLFGLVLVREHSLPGLYLSMVLAASGIFAFVIHGWFLRRGRREFSSLSSKAILSMGLVLSAVQGTITTILLVGSG